MVAKELKKIETKLQKDDACPDCGGELDDEGNCPNCNPGLDDEELDEEAEQETTE